MTIGEALKKEQDELGLTGEEMAADIITKGSYSRVINGKRRISSDLLIKILLVHNIDLSNFFEKIKDTYSTKEIKLEQRLSSQMELAVNNHDITGALTCFNQIKAANVSVYLKKRARIAVAFLTDNIKELDLNFKESIIDDLNKNDNWVFNINALLLFSTSIVILPENIVELKMNVLFTKIERHQKISEIMKEKFAIVCDNYLHWKYNQNEKFDRQSNTDEPNVLRAIRYLKSLESKQHFVIYLISAEYYSNLFSNNLKRAKKNQRRIA